MRRTAAGVLVAAFLAALAPPDTARADRVTVKGTVLEGTVKAITSKAVVMETVYGQGELSIALEDVDAIETGAPFHVFHGDDVHTVGPVVGVSPEAIRVAEQQDAETRVPLAEVHVARRDPGPEASLLERAAIELPYWRAHFDLAFSATQATTDTTALALGLNLQRERGPGRLRFESSYLRGTEQEQGEEEDTTANELRGLLRQEYDLSARLFAFGSLDAEYDEVESLSLRLVPKLGLGYVLYKSETASFSIDAGPAYVYERYFGGDTNDYPTVAFGAESKVALPFAGSTWRTRLDYLPSVTQWVDDYLLRGETTLLVPISGPLSFKWSLLDLYNSSPTEDTEGNSLATLLGLSLGF